MAGYRVVLVHYDAARSHYLCDVSRASSDAGDTESLRRLPDALSNDVARSRTNGIESLCKPLNGRLHQERLAFASGVDRVRDHCDPVELNELVLEPEGAAINDALELLSFGTRDKRSQCLCMVVLGIWSTERQHDALVQQMGPERPLPFLFDLAVEFLVRNDIDIPLMVGEFGKLDMETALERLGAFRRVWGLNW